VEDVVGLVKALGSRFIERRDAKAVQMEENPFDHEVKGWQPVRARGGGYEPFKMQDFIDHLEGRRTFGHYMVSPEGKAKLFAFDIDLNGDVGPNKEPGGLKVEEDGTLTPWRPREVYHSDDAEGRAYLIRELRAVAESFALTIDKEMGIPVAICNSGNKGLHVYGFTGTATAGEQREAAQLVLNYWGCWEAYKGEHFFRHVDYALGINGNISIEVFPKQDQLASADRLGNLMALPLGINRVTGVRKEFIRTDVDSSVLVPMDPMRALSGDLPWE